MVFDVSQLATYEAAPPWSKSVSGTPYVPR
jgi:hypothetical protein